jgi:indolepyruvate ferredoxin oxidoreductase
VTPTSEFIRNRSTRFESELLSARVKRQAAEFSGFDAEALAVGYLHEAIYTNMIMAGYAWQMGKVPVSLRGLYRAIRLNGTKVEDNMAAFNIGRIAAAAPERLAAQHDPRGHVEQKSLDELVEDRAGRLTAYQNAAYADLYRATVAEIRAAEEKAGLGENLTRAVATYAYKLMAYKDEYEVARLYTDGKFAKQLASQFKGGKLRFWLAPPIIAKKDSHGHLEKKHFGAWMMTGFKVLAKLKGLRGTKLDLFGYTEERRMERGLRDDYLEHMSRIAAELTATNHALAVEIARLPDDIRGFGHVKEAAAEKAKARETELWTGWPTGKLPKAKTSLISAAE